MASDATALKISATQKLAEFLTTPISAQAFLWTACTTMGVTSRDTAWFCAKEQIIYAY